MKQRKILKKLPYEAKVFISTLLFGVLSMHGGQNNNSKKEQDPKVADKFFLLDDLTHISCSYAYAMPIPLIKPVAQNNNLSFDNFVMAKNTLLSEPKVSTPVSKTEKTSVTKTDNAKEKTDFDERHGIKIVVGKKSVKYIYQDGTIEIREGGTLPWRNKNPGAIRKSNMASSKANGFAVFASEEMGFDALRALLRGEHYRNLTLKTAVFKYAPPHENNTTKYQSDLKRLTGLDINRKLCDLNDEEFERVLKTIKYLEGWVPGKTTMMESQTVKDTLINAMQQNIR